MTPDMLPDAHRRDACPADAAALFESVGEVHVLDVVGSRSATLLRIGWFAWQQDHEQHGGDGEQLVIFCAQVVAIFFVLDFRRGERHRAHFAGEMSNLEAVGIDHPDLVAVCRHEQVHRIDVAHDDIQRVQIVHLFQKGGRDIHQVTPRPFREGLQQYLFDEYRAVECSAIRARHDITHELLLRIEHQLGRPTNAGFGDFTRHHQADFLAAPGREFFNVIDLADFCVASHGMDRSFSAGADGFIQGQLTTARGGHHRALRDTFTLVANNHVGSEERGCRHVERHDRCRCRCRCRCTFRW
ncbi:hypothetical protein D3C72_840610 [compost metagenome]